MATIEGIYAILPADRSLEETLALAEATLRGGVRVIQLRDKRTGFARRKKKAQKLAKLVRAWEGVFIVNDSPQLALEAEAHGVHLGREDLSQSIAALRAELPKGFIIGVSCGADAGFAAQALREGADYLSFGAIFPSPTKPERPPIGLARLAKARRMFPRATIVAIGGITLEAIPAIRQAGADAAAVISALFAAEDVEAQARRMVEAWRSASLP